MILQALVELYEALAVKGILEQPGWSSAKVAWGLELDETGRLLYCLPLQREIVKNKKVVTVAREMKVPTPVKRTVGIEANFLCDNSSYVLGVDVKGKPERTLRCFGAFKDKQHRLLDGCSHPAAVALLRFLDDWKPDAALQQPVLKEHVDDIIKGGNLVFVYEGAFVHDIPEIRSIWQAAYSDEENAVYRQCLVTGKTAPVQILHPSIKGIPGAQSSGASLVSFNAPSAESYGCDESQGLNAPVSTYAAFAYGAALNYLISSEKHHLRIGDTTAVFWAEDGQEVYAEYLHDMMGSNNMDDGSLLGTLNAIADGKNIAWNNLPLEASNRFYILGLAPNAARLSVRFFLCNTFGELMRNIQVHQTALDIVKPLYDHWNELSVWWLLNETVNQNSRDKQPHPQMAGDLMRAILQGEAVPYPTTLFSQVQLRIRAERKISRGRAAIIKAFLWRNKSFLHKEVLTVQLNEETNYLPYLLGRLFSILENLQEKANPGINATIRDRYFNSATATPAIVFPTLIRLAQAHLKKLSAGDKTYFDRQIRKIMEKISESYPARLSLHDQGVFQLGYYHQTQSRFIKKEEKENV
ncbi:MAG: type I-C CRISPR-associated protein Cas8c/Csd1 [Clostridia bacterium]|nr:type I-C CRISPR-associated protein Cas8c/Csd1 [Clostridia bacterium]